MAASTARAAPPFLVQIRRETPQIHLVRCQSIPSGRPWLQSPKHERHHNSHCCNITSITDLSHDGIFVSIVDHKLTMTNPKGKEHTHMLAADATMTCDGMACKIDQLKAGMKIRVTTEKDEAGKATHVEALDKDAEFSQGN